MNSDFHSTHASLQQRLAQLKVLVVDDQPEIRALIRDMLADAGVRQILEAADGKDAMRFLDAGCDAVNIIICDWDMPGMTGIGLLRQVRGVFPDMPFLMVTGRCDRASMAEAEMAGATAVIKKPFTPDDLESKLKIMSQKSTNSDPLSSPL